MFPYLQRLLTGAAWRDIGKKLKRLLLSPEEAQENKLLVVFSLLEDQLLATPGIQMASGI